MRRCKKCLTRTKKKFKKSQYIMNNAINEIKNTLDGTKSRITEAEDRIREVEDRMVEINETERKKEKQIKRNEDNLRDLQDSVKRPNIRIIGVPKKTTRSFFIFNLDVLSTVLYRRRSFETTVKIRPITGSRRLKSKP